jgi:hypothetical protein
MKQAEPTARRYRNEPGFAGAPHFKQRERLSRGTLGVQRHHLLRDFLDVGDS